MYITYTETPVGTLKIVSDGKSITKISPSERRCDDAPDSLCERAAAELREYFSGKRTEFSFPIDPVGTDFRKRVWRELVKIPYGETRTYGQIAAAAGDPRASRAVGGAVGANPVLIAIPCHRVVAKGGIGGFSCGLWRKKILFETEGIMLPDIDK